MSLISSNGVLANGDQTNPGATPSDLLTPSLPPSNDDRSPAQGHGGARKNSNFPASVPSAWSNKQTGYLGASSAINFVSGTQTELPLSNKEYSAVSVPVQ